MEKRHEVGDSNAMGWLVTIAFHEALALLRKRRYERSEDGVERRDARPSPDFIHETATPTTLQPPNRPPTLTTGGPMNGVRSPTLSLGGSTS